MEQAQNVKFRLLRDRTARVILLSALLILCMGSLQSRDINGLYYKCFWDMKADWSGCCDVIVAGDSRVVIGVSPGQMEKVLAGRRILNYGFFANGYSREYMEALEGLLDPQSRERTILLGVTPRSLTGRSLGLNFFTVYNQKEPSEKFLNKHLAALLRFTEPMSFNDAWKRLFPKKNRKRFMQEYYLDGWIASDKLPIRPDQKLDNYVAEFKGNPVRESVIYDLVDAVKKWTDGGIKVYAFRPPTYSAMVELENLHSGFDQESFVAMFESAGGKWIGLDQQSYQSYDGSHLRRESALKLSLKLAEYIRDREG